MSFLRAQSALYGCSCERRGVRASGLGDAASDAAAASAKASGAVAAAASRSPAVARQVMFLQSELNRFGSAAPVGLRFVVPSLPVNGILDAATAARAVTILQWRLQHSIEAGPGESAAALAMLQKVTSAAAVVDPVSFVLADIPAVTALIQRYGDANALSKAAPISITEALKSLGSDSTALVMVAGAAALAFYMTRRKARR